MNYMLGAPLVEISNLSKSFPGVKALDNISVNFFPGEVHVLLGENGAGKSTLIKVLSGVYQRDSGNIKLNGRDVNFSNTKQSISSGISVIHQELSLVPDLTIAENIFLGREIKRGKLPLLNKEEMYRRTSDLLSQYEIKLNARSIVKDLNTAQRQMVEIVKAVSWNASLVIMDEPTSSLSNKEIRFLFETINKLKANNVGIVYISHKLNEIMEIGDKITVLRDGSLVKTLNAKDCTEEQLISLMVGREVKQYFHKEVDEKSEETVLRVRNLTRRSKFKNISFEVREGEIFGIAGLMGSGRTEVLRAIFGIDKIDSGSIELYGEDMIPSPRRSINQRIGFVPEDRRLQGLLLDKSINDNISLPVIKRYIKGIFVDRALEKATSKEYFQKLGIRAPSIDTMCETLSGGNQQKVILARWLAANCKILLLDEPTRGIDVNAKSEIYNLMNEFKKNGGRIVMVSSVLPEILGVADRIAVMREGVITGILERSEASEEKIMMLASTNSNKEGAL